MITKHFLFIIQFCVFSVGLFAQNNDNWNEKTSELKNNEEAELIIRVGDIDNFGFGWPNGYDPFTGEDTPIHVFPLNVDANDPKGTDCIYVGTSHIYGSNVYSDGYTGTTKRPSNLPQSIDLNYSLESINLKEAMLQLFVDDFQAQGVHSNFQVKINGQRISYIENIINALNQSGPRGKMINVKLLFEHLNLVKTGKLSIAIDDTISGIGDGFAIDFVRLLINPKPLKYKGTVNVKVIDSQTKNPIKDVFGTVSNIVESTTNQYGEFIAHNIPAGITSVTVSKSGYNPKTQNDNLITGQEINMIIKMDKSNESISKITEEVEKEKKLTLKVINFEYATADLTINSIAVLTQIFETIKRLPDLKIEVCGHTDSDGDTKYNINLSLERAQNVINWFINKGIQNKQLIIKGYGETTPIASNNSNEGRAKNRRVELKIVKE